MASKAKSSKAKPMKRVKKGSDVGKKVKGDQKVVQHLNKLLKNELTAINQYFVHSKMLEDWGINKLAAHERQESIEEMQHAELIIDRILYLEGVPNLQDLGKLWVGEDVREIIANDLKLEEIGIPDLKEAMKYAESIQDYGSRDLFLQILKDEEKHVDELETLLWQIDTLGIERFIRSQMGGEDKE